MNAFRTHTLALILLATVVLSGCSPAPDSERHALPLTEPATADRADLNAVARYRASLDDAPTPDLETDTDWPQLFGPHRTSRVDRRPANLAWSEQGPPLLWSVETGTGYGSPVVTSARVIFNHRVEDEEVVQCIDADSGSPVWEHRYPTTLEISEYDYSDGPYSTPMIAGDRVYNVGGQGQIQCLSFDDGELIWSRQLNREYDVPPGTFPVGAAPIVVDNRLIFCLGAEDREAGIVALDCDSGDTVWTATDHGPSYCSPFAATIHDQPFVFAVTSLGLVCLHPDSGEVDWFVEHFGRAPLSFNAVSPLVYQDKVLVVTGPGPGAVCVQVNPDRSYQEVWRDRRVLDSQYNTLMLFDGKVYGFTAAGQGGAELRCVDFNTGELNWKYHSILRRGQGLIAGDTLVLLGERGHLAALLPTATGPEVLAFTAEPLMSEPCYAAPAVAGDRLYLKDEQRLACFSLQ